MTAEEYIKAYTRGCSNELVGGGYHEWLTPENALAAVELAREEMKEQMMRYAVPSDYHKKYINDKGDYFPFVTYADMDDLKRVVEDLKLKDGDKVKVIIIKE